MLEIRTVRRGMHFTPEVLKRGFLGIKKWVPFVFSNYGDTRRVFVSYTECEAEVIKEIRRNNWNNTITSGGQATIVAGDNPFDN